jgi:hypothetical protein
MARERDTRKVVHGVQLYEAGQAVTYAEGDEDLLEEVLTPERGKELLEAGDLAGEGWKFAGKPAPPMTGSRLARAQEKGADAVKELEKAEEQRARVKTLGPKEARRRALDEARQREASEAAARASAEQAAESQKEHARAEKAEARAEHAHGGHGKGK